MRYGAILAAILLAAALMADPFRSLDAPPGVAEAAFPGNNGRIVFTGQKPGDSAEEIYSVNPDGTDERRLTANDTQDDDPAWSPDGTKIVYTCNPATDDDICVMNADGTNAHTVLQEEGDDDDPAWAPDGTRIVWEDDEGIKVMNEDGSDRDDLGDGHNPAWSPDGSRIAFYEGDAVWTLNADGSGRTRLAVGTSPNWSPNGCNIVYERDGDIRVMKADGSGSHVVAEGWDPAWSPDGTKIVYVTADYGSLTIIDVDGGNATTLLSSGWDWRDKPDWQPIPSQQPGVFTVNSTDDDDDEDSCDGVCDTGQTVMRDGDQEPECTLRAAIEQANEDGNQETIAFNIPGAGPHRIQPITTLNIYNPVLIDGTTQPGYQAPASAAPGVPDL